MSGPQVTITLGNSGQKVVKRPWANSDTFVNDVSTYSGSKRHLADGNDESLFSNNKRLRGDAIWSRPGYRGNGDTRIGGNDLRMKLLRKRMDRKIKQEEQKKIELQQKTARIIRSSQGPERSMMRNTPPSRRTNESLPIESLRYSSQSMDRQRRRSPNSIPKVSVGISSSRSIDEMLRLPPPRPIGASRTGYTTLTDMLDSSRPRGSASMAVTSSGMRTTLDLSKPVKEFPSASSSMLRSTYPEEPLTVSSLLNSLGLGKYSINFQAEEVDMAALKQMGDRDLKELGIPMGPRKKILLAMLARSKRPTV